MTWDGVERRRDDSRHAENVSRLISIQKELDRLGPIDVKMGIVETKIDGLKDTNVAVKNELESHTVQDRWIQGLLLAAILALLGKAFVR